ncbi:putative surface protein with fasciclin (FAS1) repeats [Filimonas zeae]|uniref:FAS1 domain-containing protein n=1 Tax=Filimonas zeae TaxID=1737353 RepID=A0A917IZC6_9BACT|nr:fasciclin domain-containing protein [Filimonas zeae]MDR6339847.1 putative surface protein with fasciclin (FAS1) repeats [Filimonas zeae]GGH69936.1 hypothetical protein GCM10011379_27740 [Filimonas zeae]
MKRIFYSGFLLMLLAGCSKEKAESSVSPDITGRLNFVIEDNLFNFSYFNAGLSRTPYRVTLTQPGPYTVLVPDNNAFVAAGYGNENAVLTENATVLNNMIGYQIVSGTWELNQLPFRFNQELTSVTGSKLYITRWVKNQDTVVTINGSRVLSYNMKASNGLIQAINTVLQPLVHKTLSDAISSDPQFTYLNAALQKADMKTQLEQETPYTVFAPVNSAFVAAGYATIQDIKQADAATLKKLLQYHLFGGRKFVYDYILATGPTDKSEQAMLSGSNITVNLLKTGINYTGITVKGIGNATVASVTKPNVLAGNGVLHTINQVLKENQ